VNDFKDDPRGLNPFIIVSNDKTEMQDDSDFRPYFGLEVGVCQGRNFMKDQPYESFDGVFHRVRP
jgi:hypothetical protein